MTKSRVLLILFLHGRQGWVSAGGAATLLFRFRSPALEAVPMARHGNQGEAAEDWRGEGWRGWAAGDGP